MNTLFLINHWLHLSAASLLIGGMIFLIAILRPVLVGNQSISGAGILADKIHNRFRTYVGILIGVIIVTGVINSLNTMMTGTGHSLSPEYIFVIRLKVLLAVCLFIIYGVNAFLIKEPERNDDEDGCSCIMKPPVYKKILQVIALMLVFTILFLAIVLRFL